MDKLKLMRLVAAKEPEAIIRALAMMTYNPAIGRVLEKGGVDKFADLMMETVPKFYGLVSRDRFDAIHAETCDRLLELFRTRQSERLSYGQAQKPLNVFLKVYVDWAKKPGTELADKLTPFLHVPLDSILMKFIAREFPEEYGAQIRRLWQRDIERFSQRLKDRPGRLKRSLLRDEFSLVGITKEIYLAWQGLLRSLYPAKPVALDTVWVVERTRLRSKSENEKP